MQCQPVQNREREEFFFAVEASMCIFLLINCHHHPHDDNNHPPIALFSTQMLAFRFDCYLQLHFQQSQKVTKKIITEKYHGHLWQKVLQKESQKELHNHRTLTQKIITENYHRKLSQPAPCSVVIAHLWHCSLLLL